MQGGTAKTLYPCFSRLSAARIARELAYCRDAEAKGGKLCSCTGSLGRGSSPRPLPIGFKYDLYRMGQVQLKRRSVSSVPLCRYPNREQPFKVE